jgi:hypothetical protein
MERDCLVRARLTIVPCWWVRRGWKCDALYLVKFCLYASSVTMLFMCCRFADSITTKSSLLGVFP